MAYGAAGSQVYFVIDNDGFAERTAWVTGGDGLLALDKNSNGKIDNQSELFGNTATHANGFANLKQYDSNADNKITSADAQFANLRVWVDADSNGKTDAGELKTLASLGITQINLAATALTNTYLNENKVSDTSTFVMGEVTKTVSDLWFRNDQMDTRYLGSYTPDIRVWNMLSIKGLGNLKDLNVAMCQDETLLLMVGNFVKTWSSGRLTNPAAVDADIMAILFKWAGVESLSPTSRGTFVDAREITFMEKLSGNFFGGGTTPLDPGGPGVGQASRPALSLLFLPFGGS